ncbi:MAG: YHS domain-containing protein [Acidiferrobacteraceae bacterium]
MDKSDMYKTKLTTQAIDPVCGVVVDSRSDVTYLHAGRIYHFCCLSCRSRFRLKPSLFIGHHAVVSGQNSSNVPTSK